jgi:hypothetical protein
MQVDAFLADSVVSAEGKLYVQGAGWNVLMTAQIPFRQSRIGVGIIVSVPYTATNQMHEFSIKLVDPDENSLPIGDAPPGVTLPDGKIRELKGQFNIGRPPMVVPGDDQIIPIAVNLDGLEFTEPNQYSVVVSIDGTEMRRLPIRVQALDFAGPQVQRFA